MHTVRILILLTVCITLVRPFDTKAEPPAVQDEREIARSVDRAFSLAVEGEDGRREARKLLKELPSEHAIPAIVEALAGPSTRLWEPRLLAYEMLSHHEAATSKEGYEQLIRGLHDPAAEIRRLCAASLDQSTIKSQLQPLVKGINENTLAEIDRRQALQKIAAWGPVARAALPSIEKIVFDGSAGIELQRSAAWAMINIAGLERALEAAKKLDGQAHEVLIEQISVFIAQADQANSYAPAGEYGKARASARNFFLESLTHSDADVRLVALASLFRAFSVDMVRFMPDGGYEWDAELRTAIISLRDDSDARIRETVEHYLAMDLDAVAKRALRWKRRHEERHLQEQKREETRNSKG